MVSELLVMVLSAWRMRPRFAPALVSAFCGLGMVMTPFAARGTDQRVYCLYARFVWNGKELRAGRLPVYGVEVPNVRRPRGTGEQPSVAYPLSPVPLRYLERHFSNRPVSLAFAPGLPREAGQLELSMRLSPCPDLDAAARPDLAYPAARARRRVELRKLKEGGDSQVLATGLSLSPSQELQYLFKWGPSSSGEYEEYEIEVAAPSGGSAFEMTFGRGGNLEYSYDWRKAPRYR